MYTIYIYLILYVYISIQIYIYIYIYIYINIYYNNNNIINIPIIKFILYMLTLNTCNNNSIIGERI